MTLTLVPGQGALPFELGSSLDDIKAAAATLGLSPSHEEPGVVYFNKNAIQVEFIAGEAIFIGVAPEVGLKLIFQHRDLLHRPASEVFDKLAREDGDAHHFDDTEYVFPNQIITLWDADPQYNLTGGDFSVWGQIGIGNDRYLEAISD